MSALVSVIIPIYNSLAYLAEAIESALAQTYAPSELIVVDDGSTDEGAAIARGFGEGVRYAFQENAGVSAARNYGVRLARGGQIAFLDADDVWLEDKLERQMAVMKARPDVDMVLGQVSQFLSPEIAPELGKQLHCDPRARDGYLPSALLARRSALERVGPFHTALGMAEFADWYLRALECELRIALLEGVVVRRRIHGKNQSRVARNEYREYLAVLKQAMDRRAGKNKEGG